MKIIKTANGYRVNMTPSEWTAIGKANGWRIADEVCERQLGETVEQAIESFMQYSADDHVQHEHEGIGSYEMWGHKMHDSGSVNSHINDFTLAVDITDIQDRDNDIPHALSGRCLGGQVEWRASKYGEKPANGKVFAIYLVR
jgi:hypothetical protein